ncbi:MAG: endonuclease [Bacteroidaceae bacterium]|nr:endonuclease [Bacteroidaceae bacterium]
MRRFYAIRILLLVSMLTVSCTAYPQSTMNVMFYNTENLFDTMDNPLKDDDEFTPDGTKAWTEKRYWEKLANVGRVIVAVDEDNAPELIGMCEVENGQVLTDLTKRTALKSLHYDYVVTDSPDRRGINVALLYKKTWFRLISVESLNVNLRPAGGGPTRDILHATGRIMTGDTIDVYVCHWPSRINGEDETESRRRIAASVAMGSIRKVFGEREKPYVILMGDLNEGPSDSAVRDVMGAASPDDAENMPDTAMVALMYGRKPGSYRYDGEWNTYDQFVVSASFLNGLGCTAIENVHIGAFDFIMEEDNRYGGRKPYRTYNGRRYQGGFSDHLPIALDLAY